eukprot:scaffold821_cov123-Skeletonema_dohrnii-CCMP3373.AAC.5
MKSSKNRSCQRWPGKIFFALLIALPMATAFANPSSLPFPTQKLNNPSSTAFISTKRFNTHNNYDVEVKETRQTTDKYHLIWSPSFWKKAAVSTIIYKSIQLLADRNNLSSVGRISSCHQSKITALVLPLLSSSCCAVQLIINALSGWGCAGFNTILGPVRPLLLPLLLISTWNLLPQRSLGWTALSLFLAFLPELVYIFNSLARNQWKKEKYTSLQNNAVTARLQLAIPTMGCIACVNKIDTSIRQCDSATSITQEKSWLTEGSEKGGKAELKISAQSREEIDKVVQNVVTAIKNAGFESETESLQID